MCFANCRNGCVMSNNNGLNTWGLYKVVYDKIHGNYKENNNNTFKSNMTEEDLRNLREFNNYATLSARNRRWADTVADMRFGYSKEMNYSVLSKFSEL